MAFKAATEQPLLASRPRRVFIRPQRAFHEGPGLFSVKGGFNAVRLEGDYRISLSHTGNLWSGTAGGYLWSYSQDTGTLSVEAVPEPATWLLLGLGGAAWLLHRRRRSGTGVVAPQRA